MAHRGHRIFWFERLKGSLNISERENDYHWSIHTAIGRKHGHNKTVRQGIGKR